MPRRNVKSVQISREKRVKRPFSQPLSPPQIINTYQFTRTFRWYYSPTSVLVDQVITTGNILDSLVVAVTTSLTFSIIEAYRIKRIELWSPASASPAFDISTGAPLPNSPTVCSLEFNGSGGGNVGTKPTRVLDTSMGGSRNAKVMLKPPKDSAAADWQVTPETGTQTNGGGFIVGCTSGSVLDITMAVLLQNGSPVNAGPPASGPVLVVGTLYQAPLDGTTGNWIALNAKTYPV